MAEDKESENGNVNNLLMTSVGSEFHEESKVSKSIVVLLDKKFMQRELKVLEGEKLVTIELVGSSHVNDDLPNEKLLMLTPYFWKEYWEKCKPMLSGGFLPPNEFSL